MKKRKQKTKNYQIRKAEKTKKISKNSHFLELIFPVINQYLFNLYCHMTEISLKSFLVANVHFSVKNSKAVCKTLKIIKTQKYSFLAIFWFWRLIWAICVQDSIKHIIFWKYNYKPIQINQWLYPKPETQASITFTLFYDKFSPRSWNASSLNDSKERMVSSYSKKLSALLRGITWWWFSLFKLSSFT